MKSWRLLLAEVAVNEVPVDASYADLFVVLREGDERPGPNDWEATIQTTDHQQFRPGNYELRGGTHDDCSLSGHAILRYSDGHRHHFRGDGDLGGVDDALA